MAEIESESQFVWKFIWNILLTPITLVMIIFKKKQVGDLFKPFADFFRFVWEPKFTVMIILLNIAAFFYSSTFSEATMSSLANYPSDVLQISQWHTLITSGFLHLNLAHLLGNMAAIFIFGRAVERTLGFWKTAAVYFGALVVSNIFSSLISLYLLGENMGGVGASGALMGLVSVAILMDPFYLTYELIVPLPIMVVGWIAIYGDITGILNPAEDGIGHLAHVGGFLSVMATMFFLNFQDKAKLKKGLLINIASIAVIYGIYFFFLQDKISAVLP
ncbi:rhomboid family intramembrane serine protease [Candidatus Woesearchaeota archaeon]|nr:rhomboid family intramembrane serine protease [Candidatus Woesearchaeota archaeon]